MLVAVVLLVVLTLCVWVGSDGACFSVLVGRRGVWVVAVIVLM